MTSRLEDVQVKGKTVERVFSCGHTEIVEFSTDQVAYAYVQTLAGEVVDCIICFKIVLAQDIICAAELEKATLLHAAAYLNGAQCELAARERLAVQGVLNWEIASLEEKIVRVAAAIQRLGQQAHRVTLITEWARA
jgi:hypothetical protein